MQFLKARDFGTRVIFEIWLDPTKTLADGSTPDPKWVMELTYSIPSQASRDAFIQQSTQEAQLFANSYMRVVNAKDAGVPLPVEGTTF